MSTISHEVVQSLASVQNQVWQTVSLTVNEASGLSLTFGDPLTVANQTSDLYAEMAAPKLVVQFAFANLPENSQVILLSEDTFRDLAAMVKDEEIESVDENLVSEVRPVLEAIVQGICLAVGNVRNEAVVASGLSVRFQIFSFPPNLQRAPDLLRTNVAITGENINGSCIWLADNETAHVILGLTPQEEESTTPFGPIKEVVMGGAASTASHVDENAALEILMDVPLELSVELGRVKMLIKDVVELGSGSIVEIEKAAGEPVDVLVNGRIVARGEVVVIEDNFGVRITEILSPQERLARLNEVA